MEDHIRVSKKFDGLIVVGHRPDFLRPGGLLLKSIKVQRVDKSRLKGISNLDKEGKHFRISIAQEPVSYGFLLTVGTHARRLNEDEVKQFLKECILEAISKMTGRKTLKSKRNDWYENVHAEDQEQFSRNLEICFNERMETEIGQNKFDLIPIAYQMGMDMRWVDIKIYLEFFYWERVKEAIIHYAQNFELQGCVLFWKSSTRRIFQGGKLSSKYNVAMLRDAWNYFYKLDCTVDKYHLDSVKFYCELFKEAHKGNERGVPFTRPALSNQLFSPREFEPNIPGPKPGWTDHEVSVGIAKNMIQGVGNTFRMYAARFEVVVCLKNLQEDAKAAIYGIPRFVNSQPNLDPYLLVEHIEEMPVADLKQHVEANILPFAETLSRMIRKRKYSLQAEGGPYWDGIGPEDFFTSLVCENALRLAFYGTEMRDGRVFPDIVRDPVGLTVRSIANRPATARQDWIFSSAITKLPGENSTVTASIPAGIGENVIKSLDQYFGPQHENKEWNLAIVNLLETVRLYSPGCNEAELLRDVGLVGDILFEHFLSSCLYFTKSRGRFQTRSLNAVALRNWDKEGNMKYITSRNLATRIVTCKERRLEDGFLTLGKHRFVCWMANIANFILKECEKQDVLIKVLAEKIEAKMLEEGRLFVVPVRKDTRLVVIPLSYSAIRAPAIRKLCKDFKDKLKGLFERGLRKKRITWNDVSENDFEKVVESFTRQNMGLSSSLDVFVNELLAQLS